MFNNNKTNTHSHQGNNTTSTTNSSGAPFAVSGTTASLPRTTSTLTPINSGTATRVPEVRLTVNTIFYITNTTTRTSDTAMSNNNKTNSNSTRGTQITNFTDAHLVVLGTTASLPFRTTSTVTPTDSGTTPCVSRFRLTLFTTLFMTNTKTKTSGTLTPTHTHTLTANSCNISRSVLTLGRNVHQHLYHSLLRNHGTGRGRFRHQM